MEKREEEKQIKRMSIFLFFMTSFQNGFKRTKIQPKYNNFCRPADHPRSKIITTAQFKLKI